MQNNENQILKTMIKKIMFLMVMFIYKRFQLHNSNGYVFKHIFLDTKLYETCEYNEKGTGMGMISQLKNNIIYVIQFF